jgi:hypothetical protein
LSVPATIKHRSAAPSKPLLVLSVDKYGRQQSTMLQDATHPGFVVDWIDSLGHGRRRADMMNGRPQASSWGGDLVAGRQGGADGVRWAKARSQRKHIGCSSARRAIQVPVRTVSGRKPSPKPPLTENRGKPARVASQGCVVLQSCDASPNCKASQSYDGCKRGEQSCPS